MPVRRVGSSPRGSQIDRRTHLEGATGGNARGGEGREGGWEGGRGGGGNREIGFGANEWMERERCIVRNAPRDFRSSAPPLSFSSLAPLLPPHLSPSLGWYPHRQS